METEEPIGGPAWTLPIVAVYSARVLGALLVLGSLALVSLFIMDKEHWPSPSVLELPFFSATGAILYFASWVPWKHLRITRIGQVEFAAVIETQAKEHAEELGELMLRIEEIEGRLRAADSTAKLMETFRTDELNSLLRQFFEKYDGAFSPVKIQKWGSKQPGFEGLREFDLYFVKSMLRQLMLEGYLVTTVSKLGNTLYKLAYT